ncbi:hypothetical protein H735_12695 [Vibrio owensii CAIM 1854 = LMG 25443]|uniref:Uncharacterized protein n=1 Tax=Vibrio owensii CAIM 1854 = LMG 25443 TaxID=1229493 RepID=A0A0C1VS87_9VIBR|nr:hypothetical protein H735_12695 [Vibrio owensii CAIM 1854 = LMG 25443]
MPYCKSAISITKEMNVSETLYLLSQMKFGALRAVQFEWNHNQYIVDSGMNNIRAVVDSEENLILFHCRYPNYIEVMESLLATFTFEQGLFTSNRDT